MPINPQIPLQVNSGIDLSPGLNALATAFQYRKDEEERKKKEAERLKDKEELVKDRAQERELRGVQIANEKFKQFDEREQRRLKSTILMGAELDDYLQRGDTEGALGKLESRKQIIEQAKTIIPTLDTNETDEMIGLVKSGQIDKLKEITKNAIKMGQQLKILEAPEKKDGFTLSEGQQRYGPDGKLIASVDPKSQLLSPEEMEQQMQLKIAGRSISNQSTPVTPVTIQDPNNPGETIVIDGRSRAVLGKGPKLTQIGAAEQKLSLAKPQAEARVKSMTQNLDRLDAALKELDADTGLSNITGTIAGRTPNLTNTATGAQAKLDSIKSQVFQSSLQAMREASKTGGAVGNVSDREGDKLEQTLGALSQAQSTDDFKDQIKKIRAQLKLSKEIINNAFDEQFGHIEAYTPARRATDGKPGSTLRFDAQGNPL